MDRLSEALTLMRRALQILDECDDPYFAGADLDLAISKLDCGLRGTPTSDDSRSSGDEVRH
jgi:hypothetical protein